MNTIILLFLISILNHTQGSRCPNTQNVKLTGTSLVCPKEIGFYRCTVLNRLILGWNIDDYSDFFSATDQVGTVLTLTSPNSNTTAYLVERIVLDENFLQGTRTSILSHEIDPNFMGTFVIICDGGEGNICNQTVYAIGGADPFSMPSTLITNVTTQNNITFTWTHPSLEMVDHFNVLVEGSSADQLFQVNSTEVVISRFPGISFNVSFSAVDICGRESSSVQLQVNGSQTLGGVSALLSLLLLLSQI